MLLIKPDLKSGQKMLHADVIVLETASEGIKKHKFGGCASVCCRPATAIDSQPYVAMQR